MASQPALPPSHDDSVRVNILPSTPIHTFDLPLLGSRDDLWIVGRAQFELIVDNQVVCNLLTGAAALDNPKCESQLKDALNSIESMLFSGWTPRYITKPLVKWRPRKYNTLADALATSAMKLRTDLNFIDNKLFSLIDWPNCQIQLFSDGGSNRDDQIASIGFACILWQYKDQQWSRRPVIAGARFYASYKTAFETEITGAMHVLSLLAQLTPNTLM
jgi:hypothetical protein